MAYATAFAADLPDATDAGVLRLGPLAAAAFQRFFPTNATTEERRAAGGFAWAQYEGAWFAYDCHVGGLGYWGGGGGAESRFDWDNEYAAYLVGGRFRPYVAGAVGLRRRDGPAAHETTPLLGVSFGLRVNAAASPFYLTFGSGFRYASGWRAVIQNRYFFGLTRALGLHARAEVGSSLWGDNALYAQFEAGPALSF